MAANNLPLDPTPAPLAHTARLLYKGVPGGRV